MTNAYVPMDFEQDEAITRDMMNTLNGNSQWLYENTPRGRFIRDPKGLDARSTRLVIVSGRRHFSKSKKSPFAGKRVEFGSKMFADNCIPSVTLGVGAKFPVHTFVNGFGKHLHPQSNGFEIRCFVPGRSGEKWLIPKNFVVYWQAIGWRENTNNDY